MPPTPVTVVKRVVDAARQWFRSRTRLRKLLDSKSAQKEDIDKARNRVVRDAAKLEAAVVGFEIFYQSYVGRPGKPPKTPFPWRELLGAVAAGAGALEKVMGGGMPRKVIDVEAEVSDPPR